MHVRSQIMTNLGYPYCPIGFWLELWFLFDGESTQTFFNRSDCFDNAQLATDIGLSPFSSIVKFGYLLIAILIYIVNVAIMCYNPTKIPNPNYGKKYGKKYETIHDTTAQYISVPCGHCYACLAIRQEYFIQRMQMENISNDLWTGMLSYNHTSLPTITIGKYVISYASSRDIQLLIKRLRNRCLFPNGFKYWFISERGSRKHRPHWHFIISTPKIPDESIAEKYHREKIYHDAILEEWYTNHGSKRSPVKVPNLTYCCKHGKRNYDFHYCNPLLTKDGNLM